MNKIKFPKGSLSFKKIGTKTDGDPMPDMKEHRMRKFFNNIIESFYSNERKEILPANLLEEIKNNQTWIREDRQMLNVKVNNLCNNYEVTFKHPKWFPIIGAIVIQSNKEALSDTLKSIMKEFKHRKDEHRKFRKRNKTVNINSYKSKITYDISGGIIYMPHVKEGVFVKFLKDQERKIVYAPKFPKETNEKYVGIELEFLAPVNKDYLGNKLYDAGLGKFITLTEDGSIKCCNGKCPNDCEEHQDKLFAHELCIIAKENEYKDIMNKVCKLLNDEGAIVNKTCGMHVHVDCRSRDPEKVYQNLMSSQNILLRMNPKSRTEKYAKKNVERDFTIASAKAPTGTYDENRYFAINAKAFNKHQTIEVRIHSGTTDYKKITNWISMIVNISDTVERYVRNFSTINTFCKRFNINEELQTYIEERINKFKIKIDENEKEIIPEAERGVA